MIVKDTYWVLPNFCRYFQIWPWQYLRKHFFLSNKLTHINQTLQLISNIMQKKRENVERRPAKYNALMHPPEYLFIVVINWKQSIIIIVTAVCVCEYGPVQMCDPYIFFLLSFSLQHFTKMTYSITQLYQFQCILCTCKEKKTGRTCVCVIELNLMGQKCKE